MITSQTFIFLSLLLFYFPALNFTGGLDADPETLTLKQDINKSKMTAFLERVRNSHTALSRRHRRKKMMTASAVAETEYYIVGEKENSDIIPPRKRALRPKTKVCKILYC